MLGIFWSYVGDVRAGENILETILYPEISAAYPEFEGKGFDHIRLHELSLVGPAGGEFIYNRTKVRLTNTRCLNIPSYADECYNLQALQDCSINLRFLF